MTEARHISDEKKLTAKNLYASDIPEEFIAIQLDLDIPTVIGILKEIGTYSVKDYVVARL